MTHKLPSVVTSNEDITVSITQEVSSSEIPAYNISVKRNRVYNDIKLLSREDLDKLASAIEAFLLIAD